METLDKIAISRINELTSNAMEQIGKAVLPIYGSTDTGRAMHIGSCIAVEKSGVKYLITAAHLIDSNKETTLYIGGNKLITLQGEFIITSAPNGIRSNDRFDFAIMKMDDVLCKELIGINYCNETQCDIDSNKEENEFYTCIGFPNSKNQNKIDNINKIIAPQKLPFTNKYSWNEGLASKLEVSSKSHIMIPYNHKLSKNHLGEKVNSIKLNGMSGGAVVNIGNLAKPLILSGKETPSPRLSGVIIEYHKSHGSIVATRISELLGVI